MKPDTMIMLCVFVLIVYCGFLLGKDKHTLKEKIDLEKFISRYDTFCVRVYGYNKELESLKCETFD